MHACAGDTINLATSLTGSGLVNTVASANALTVKVALASATITASRALEVRFAWKYGGTADLSTTSDLLVDFFVSVGSSGTALAGAFGTGATHGGLAVAADTLLVQLGTDATIAAGACT